MTSYLRLLGDDLQTPAHRLTGPGGRQVLLIATYHHGTPTYYATLRKLIDSAVQGTLVRCEGGTRLPNAADATDDEQALLNQMRQLRELETTRLTAWGWTSQNADDGLGYPPEWEIVDVSDLDLMRRLGMATQQRLVQRGMRTLNADGPVGLARCYLRLARGIRLTARIRALPDRIRVGDRNAEALADVDRLPGKDLTLPWGCAHIPGLLDGLYRRGYRLDVTTWHTVATLPTRAELKAALTAAKRKAKAAAKTQTPAAT